MKKRPNEFWYCIHDGIEEKTAFEFVKDTSDKYPLFMDYKIIELWRCTVCGREYIKSKSLKQYLTQVRIEDRE
jgi:rubredoxin